MALFASLLLDASDWHLQKEGTNALWHCCEATLCLHLYFLQLKFCLICSAYTLANFYPIVLKNLCQHTKKSSEWRDQSPTLLCSILGFKFGKGRAILNMKLTLSTATSNDRQVCLLVCLIITYFNEDCYLLHCSHQAEAVSKIEPFSEHIYWSMAKSDRSSLCLYLWSPSFNDDREKQTFNFALVDTIFSFSCFFSL